MKCPYLIEKGLTLCNATNVTYLPSIFEIAEYCAVCRHKKCPFYCYAAEDDVFDLEDDVFDLTDQDLWPNPFS